MKNKLIVASICLVSLLASCGETTTHPDKYTLTYDQNYSGSTNIIIEVDYVEGYQGALIKRPNSLYRTALCADTWSENKNGTPVFDFNANLITKKDMTFYAIWEDGTNYCWPSQATFNRYLGVEVSIPVNHLNVFEGTSSVVGGDGAISFTFSTTDANPLEYYADVLTAASWTKQTSSTASVFIDSTNTVTYSATLSDEVITTSFMVNN